MGIQSRILNIFNNRKLIIISIGAPATNVNKSWRRVIFDVIDGTQTYVKESQKYPPPQQKKRHEDCDGVTTRTVQNDI